MPIALLIIAALMASPPLPTSHALARSPIEAPVIPCDAADDERRRLDVVVDLLTHGRHAEALHRLRCLAVPSVATIYVDARKARAGERQALARGLATAASAWSRALRGSVLFRTSERRADAHILLRFEPSRNPGAAPVEAEPPVTSVQRPWSGRRVRLRVRLPSPGEPDAGRTMTSRVSEAIGAYMGLAPVGSDGLLPTPEEAALARRLMQVRAHLIELAAQSRPVTAARPALLLNRQTVDIGEIREGETAQFSFAVENRGSALLEMDVAPTCGCTVIASDRVVAAGGVGRISGELRTDGLAGAVSKDIELTTNDPRNPTLTVHVRATVRPIVQILPADPFTVALPDGIPSVAAYEVRYADPAPVTITKAVCDAPFATATFKPSEAVPGGFSVRLTFSPAAPVGQTSVTTILQTTSTRRPQVAIHTICVKGIILSPPTVYLGAVSPAAKTPRTLLATLTRATGIFHVRRVFCRDSALIVGVGCVRDGTEYRLSIRYHGGWKPGPARAEAIVETDDPVQPRVIVPVTASVLGVESAR